MKKVMMMFVVSIMLTCGTGFNVAGATVLVSPNGGETFISGTNQIIEWSSPAPVDANVLLEYSVNNGYNWQDINTVANTGLYNWDVPEVTSNQCLVRVTEVNDSNFTDVSDNIFIIYACRLSSPANLDKDCDVDFADFSIFALDWLRNGNPFDESFTEIPDSPDVMVWIDIAEPNFTGQISKYETTNAQYCAFLNAALASGDITVGADNKVYGATGSNPGGDFVDELYCETDTLANPESVIVFDDGTFYVRTHDGHDMNNHPVVEVGWYGATAFCNYYGYRLPTEWEWQAVADYDGSYVYGCGTSIDGTKANYNHNNPLGVSSNPERTPVGYFGSFGYGLCDMAGNVDEWTSSLHESGYYVFRSGSYARTAAFCTVSYRNYDVTPTEFSGDNGFRVVMGSE